VVLIPCEYFFIKHLDFGKSSPFFRDSITFWLSVFLLYVRLSGIQTFSQLIRTKMKLFQTFFQLIRPFFGLIHSFSNKWK
jgi:hypothetical protein